MTTKETYISKLNRQKQIDLNDLIDRFEGTPVGTGYIDIIVLRDRCFEFINELTKLDLAVEAVSWWCLATEENQRNLGCPHGSGGPETKFGWFTEIYQEFDGLEEDELFQLDHEFNRQAITTTNLKSIAIIKEKKMVNPTDGKQLTFNKTACLTPGIWVYVPSDWTREDK
jgi:hypothetical protein